MRRGDRRGDVVRRGDVCLGDIDPGDVMRRGVGLGSVVRRGVGLHERQILAQAIDLGGQGLDLGVGFVQLRLHVGEFFLGGSPGGFKVCHLRLQFLFAAGKLRLRLVQRGLRLRQRRLHRGKLRFQCFLVGGELLGLRGGLGKRLFQGQILAALLLELGAGACQLRVARGAFAVEIDHGGDGRDEQYQQHRKPYFVFALHKQPSMRLIA